MNIDQSICQKHKQLIQFICAANNCKQNRRICEQCKQKQALHFSYHGNYIFKVKEFYEFNNSKTVIPRLEKGIQDIENVINKHKHYYQQQIFKINEDFSLILKTFEQITNKYKKIYLQNFQKEVNCFDEEYVTILNNIKSYTNEKSHQQSFFSKLFTNDSKSTQDIDDIVSKNIKGFDVRASIINLKSKMAMSKSAKTSYKSTQVQQNKFNSLIESLNTFSAQFYDRLKDLVTTQNSNAQQKNSLKSSIVAQTKSLSISRANSITMSEQEGDLKRSLVLGTESRLIKTTMPEPNPKVMEIKKFLKALPEYTQTNSKQQGPFKYQNGTYLGSYQNGVRSGKGTFVFDDGSYYEGGWENDNMSGYGRLIKYNSYYEGDISNGQAHGKGNYQDFQKTYSGDWKQDKRHGLGQQQFKDRKRRYVGTFINDKYQGRGKLVEQDYIYDGQFRNGKFDGQGLIRYRNGQLFKGSFKQNCRVFGRHNLSQDVFYEGTFKENMPHGNGQFQYKDGIRYSGQWKNGLQEGIGIQIHPNGKQMKGIWQHGEWVRWV